LARSRIAAVDTASRRNNTRLSTGSTLEKGYHATTLWRLMQFLGPFLNSNSEKAFEGLEFMIDTADAPEEYQNAFRRITTSG
jgi:hypothetical protein